MPLSHKLVGLFLSSGTAATRWARHSLCIGKENDLCETRLPRRFLTIGSDKTDLLKKARDVERGNYVEILLACLVSLAHDSYEMYVLKPGETEFSDPVYILCDMVSKALSGTDNTVQSIQRKRKCE